MTAVSYRTQTDDLCALRIPERVLSRGRIPVLVTGVFQLLIRTPGTVCHLRRELPA